MGIGAMWLEHACTSFVLMVVLNLAMLVSVQAAKYNMVKEYAGSKFFDDWVFYDHFDNFTNGDAIFVSSSTAKSQKLAYIDPSTNRAIIKVDNTTKLPFNQKRNTVRIETKDRYAIGSVWVADMTHVPFGCSVWPAWWSSAPNWPQSGEIDTFEAVNLIPRHQMGLHTLNGCKQVSPVQTSTLVNSTDCNFQVNNNEGCVLTNPSSASFGESFAQAGGGVWVTEFAEGGISIWFFERKDVPSVLSSNASTIDMASLGTPTANWPSGGCNVNQFFEPQHLVFDITLCGDFAGNPAIFSQTCSGLCYDDYVLGPPWTYDNAYFEIAYVRVFGEPGVDTVLEGNGALVVHRIWWWLAALIFGYLFS